MAVLILDKVGIRTKKLPEIKTDITYDKSINSPRWHNYP